MASSWDFRPQDIRIAVHLWHGEADANAPVAMGRYMATTIPNSQVSYYPGEGHLSLMAKYATEILRALATRAPAREP
jgi:pimeloyl-ACP methyl ester carboxylesterase